MIHVCSLARLDDTVRRTGARHVVTLINDNTPVVRPAPVAPENHLFLALNDIVEPMEGYVAPAEEHVSELLAFVRGWHAAREAPLVLHCWAGISRSTAAAFTAVCALAPHRDETGIALRLRAASPTATPNIRIVRFADRLLGRDGRMVAAIEAIGRGRETHEGEPFRLDLD